LIATENKPPMKVVIDTNVFISGLNFPGNPKEILKLFRTGEIQVYISSFILKEITKILSGKFKWSKREMAEAVTLIKRKAYLVKPERRLSVVKKKDNDNRILECAVDADVQFIISGDKKHLLSLKEFEGIKIVSPAEFLNIF